MKNYNDFCASRLYSEYIEWDWEFEPVCQPYPCVSCQMVGQIVDIDMHPDDCHFIDDIQNIELEYEE